MCSALCRRCGQQVKFCDFRSKYGKDGRFRCPQILSRTLETRGDVLCNCWLLLLCHVSCYQDGRRQLSQLSRVSSFVGDGWEFVYHERELRN